MLPIAQILRTDTQVPWQHLAKLLVSEVSFLSSLSQETPLPEPAKSTPPAPPPAKAAGGEKLWEPSPVASLLTEILHRTTSPTATVRLRVTTPTADGTAEQIRSAIEQSGMSYHARAAEAVSHGRPHLISELPVPRGEHPFDQATLVMMQGQFKTVLDTPMGPAVAVWHREDEAAPSPQGKPVAGVKSVTLALNHPELGALVAHIHLQTNQIDVEINCDEAAAPLVAASLPALQEALSGSVGLGARVHLGELPA